MCNADAFRDALRSSTSTQQQAEQGWRGSSQVLRVLWQVLAHVRMKLHAVKKTRAATTARLVEARAALAVQQAELRGLKASRDRCRQPDVGARDEPGSQQLSIAEVNPAVGSMTTQSNSAVGGTAHYATAHNDTLVMLAMLNAMLLAGREPPSSDYRKRSSTLPRMRCCKALRCADSDQLIEVTRSQLGRCSRR